MVDYKAALVNAGAFAVGAASFIAGVFILPQEFGNLERLIMVASIVGVYSVGHACGQRFAVSAFRSEKENLHAALDDERRKNAELEKRWDDLHAEERRTREAELRARRNFDADRLLLLTPRECVAIDKILRAKDGVEYLQDGTDVEALIERHIIYEAENVSFDGMFYVGVEGTRMCAIERAELPYFSRYAQQVAEVAREYSAEALVRVADQIRHGIPGVEPLGDTRRTGETDHTEEVAG